MSVTGKHSTHSYTAMTLLNNSWRGINVISRMRRCIKYKIAVVKESCMHTAFSGQHCGKYSGDRETEVAEESVLHTT